ncbi:glycosyltransferase family 4 protein [Spongiibacter sp. UBA1325]|uniref:glycosyltransferase family 4 protein n=1 Tax=Spongiibacter sp. UBA1325 TaxID=1947543 RepID=UPI00257A72FB|nr:glycosyltransferase family 4 protein [Spongiibacter sp. UBA1325]|tara:strand:+ start:31 stop:1353 length:1323 start_codon:yes stop_codon:yes gene_type:complete
MSSDPTALAQSATAATGSAQVIPIEEARPQRRLHICLLGYRSAPFGGGQGIYLKYLSKALVDAGHEVDVISGQPYPHLDPRVKLIKMPGMNLFETGLGSLRPHHLSSLTNIIEWSSKLTGGFAEPYCFGRRVVKYLKRHGRHYDIIHDNQSLSFGMLKLQKLGFPLVTTIHHPITSDLDIALKAANSLVDRVLIRRWHSFIQMQRQVAPQLHHVVTVSERSREDIAAAFGMQPAAIQLVHCGIDTDEFRPLPSVKKIPRRLMATVSADAPLKGMSYLFEAVAKLLPRYPDLQLLMVGKIREGGEAEALIEKLGLHNHIATASGISTEQLVRYYNEAEVAVVPSVYEGFGLPAGEAMACGTALVSTTGGALPEVTGDAALQVPVRDAQALADGIDTLLSNAEQRRALEVAGRERMEELFCWSRAAQQMLDYYEQVLRSENG